MLAHSVWTTYTCHTATLISTIAVENFGMEYFRKTVTTICETYRWVALRKKLSSHLTNILRSSIYEIDPTLRVKTLFSALARAYDKGFSISANYPKVFGELFI